MHDSMQGARQSAEQGALKLLPLPALADNYIWLLHDGQQALVIDPGEAAGVQAYLQHHGLRLSHLWITHQHRDHIEGVPALQAAWRPHIVGAVHPSIQALAPMRVVQGGARMQALGLEWQVMAAPGHTLTHVLFCGDTLFSASCGRLFEGSPTQMLATLQTILSLPDDTLICCTHEYTQTNLRFALALEPHNTDLQQALQHCSAQRAAHLSTLPSSLQRERKINPFLRVFDPAFARAMALHLGLAQNDALTVFTALRQARDGFI